MQLKGNTILITGGATGIGRGMAERFLTEGNKVLICGRRNEVLTEAASLLPGLITIPCDLSQPEERERLFNLIQQDHPEVNVLVNNAGIQNWMHIEEADFFQRSQEEIRINIEAPLHLMSLFQQLPGLKTILNVSSGLAFVPLINVPVYCATKAFLHSLTKSLRIQLKPKNIKVIEVIPPALNTDLGGKGIHDAYPPVSAFIDAIFPQLAAGKEEVTFGFSEQMAGSAQVLEPVFQRMNQLG